MFYYILGIVASAFAVAVGFTLLLKTKNSFYALMIVVSSMLLTICIFLTLSTSLSVCGFEKENAPTSSYEEYLESLGQDVGMFQ